MSETTDLMDALVYQVAAQMQLGLIRYLDTPLVLSAARLGLQHQIPLADSVRFGHSAKVQRRAVDSRPGLRGHRKRPLLPQKTITKDEVLIPRPAALIEI